MQAGNTRPVVGIVLGSEYQRKTCDRHSDFRRRSIDKLTNRSADGADKVVAAQQSAQPVRLVNHLAAADAGKQIFVSAGKPYNFVRKYGSANYDLVIIEKQAIDLHQNRFG